MNRTIQLVKLTLTQNQNNIIRSMDTLQKTVKDILTKNIYIENLLILSTLRNHVEHIQNFITTAQNKIGDATILTKQEIDDYDIDISKIKYLRTAIFENQNELIFLIKVPKTFQSIQTITIIPVPFLYREIEAEIENIFKYNNKIYKYEENKFVNECKISKHCTIKKTCKLVKNYNTEIINVNDQTIIIKNAKNNTITNNLSNKNEILNGNYLIQYNNCTLMIANEKFSNKNKLYLDKIIVPKFQNVTFNNTLTMEEVKLTTI